MLAEFWMLCSNVTKAENPPGCITFGIERMPVELISRSREPWVSVIEAAAACNGRIKFSY